MFYVVMNKNDSFETLCACDDYAQAVEYRSIALKDRVSRFPIKQRACILFALGREIHIVSDKKSKN